MTAIGWSRYGPVPGLLDLPPRHLAQERRHEAVARAHDVGRAEDGHLAVGAEQLDLGRELGAEIAIRAAPALAVARDPETAEVDHAGHTRGAGRLDDALVPPTFTSS
jgi:hypothetical protein